MAISFKVSGMLSALVFPCLVLLAGCATTPTLQHTATVTKAYDHPEDTSLGAVFKVPLAAHPEKTGVALVPTGEWGFRARFGLMTMAEKTLDLQYYIWDNDTAGSVLAIQLLRAADRGVRVRILLDDIGTEETEFGFSKVARHPNIDIRLFNPFASRGFRMFNLLTDFERLNHRMHNKVFIADNAVAIIGGRNIADDYFGVDSISNFRDLDLTLAGPAVQDISRSFDDYWNSEWAVPIDDIIPNSLTDEEFQSQKIKAYQWVEALQNLPFPITKSREDMFAKLKELQGAFVWAPVKILVDPPDKVETDEERVAVQLTREGSDKEHELMLETAYFIAGKRGLEAARINQENGIRTRILTNSLATNDVAAAFAGYAKYRKDLIRSGVELYELRPDADAGKEGISLLAGKSRASLHTKAIIIDRETIAIGSFNMDPRSIAINTEIVVVVESPELSRQVAEYIEEGMLPENSYRVVLESDQEGGERLVWITEQDGKEVRYYSEPGAGFWRLFSAWFMSLLPIEEQL